MPRSGHCPASVQLWASKITRHIRTSPCAAAFLRCKSTSSPDSTKVPATEPKWTKARRSRPSYGYDHLHASWRIPAKARAGLKHRNERLLPHTPSSSRPTGDTTRTETELPAARTGHAKFEPSGSVSASFWATSPPMDIPLRSRTTGRKLYPNTGAPRAFPNFNIVRKAAKNYKASHSRHAAPVLEKSDALQNIHTAPISNEPEASYWVHLTELPANCTGADIIAALAAIGPIGRVMSLKLSLPNKRHPRHAVASIQVYTTAAVFALSQPGTQEFFIVKNHQPHITIQTKDASDGEAALEDLPRDGPQYEGYPPSRVLVLRGPVGHSMMRVEALRRLFVLNDVDIKSGRVFFADGATDSVIVWPFLSWREQAKHAMTVLREKTSIPSIRYGRDPCEYPEDLLDMRALERLEGMKFTQWHEGLVV